MPNGLLRVTSVQTAAVVGSYFPRQCGIATFSKDLRDAVAAEIGQRQASVVAIDDNAAGVGPMRCYAIGAMLLDLHDPLKVIGHLREPLITPLGEEREGYVPNVVYTCGSMVHGDHLLIPYAQADKSTGISAVNLTRLIDHLIDSGVG